MPTQDPATDRRAAPVIPEIVCNHPEDVTEVNAVPNYRLSVRFNDGTAGLVDVRPLIFSEAPGVFAQLADPKVFDAVYVCLGAVTWPGEIDLAPDAMYEALRATGEWILD